MKCHDCRSCSIKELLAWLHLKVLGSNLVSSRSCIRHSSWPAIYRHSILWQVWTDEREPPTKHCLCSVASFHVRKLRNHRGVGGCLFHVPMDDLFHEGWSVNSQLVLTAANEKHEPFLNICQVPLSVPRQYSWIWQENIPVLTTSVLFFFIFTKMLNKFLLQTICEQPKDGQHLITLFYVQFYSCSV